MAFSGLASAQPAAKPAGEKPVPAKVAEEKVSKAAAAPAVATPAAEAPDLASFLVKPATQAVEKRKYKLAVSLWRGIVAIRGDADPSVWKLAEAWTLGGQFEQAAEELERYRDAVSSSAEKDRAQKEITALRDRPTGFTAQWRQPEPARKEAGTAFQLGRKAFKAKKYAEAILYYKAGYAMAPDLPGNLRELGEAYETLGRTEEAINWYSRYLRMRPFGKNSDQVRKRLAALGAVGKVSVESSLPCEQVWMDGQPMPMKLPVKELIVAPGRHRFLCYSEKYHLTYYSDWTNVKKGETVKFVFGWAVIQNKLNPWGRVVIENPLVPGQMNDVGLFEEIGVPVPADRRALKVRMRSGDGSKNKEIFIKLEPGQTLKLEW